MWWTILSLSRALHPGQGLNLIPSPCTTLLQWNHTNTVSYLILCLHINAQQCSETVVSHLSGFGTAVYVLQCMVAIVTGLVWRCCKGYGQLCVCVCVWERYYFWTQTFSVVKRVYFGEQTRWYYYQWTLNIRTCFQTWQTVRVKVKRRLVIFLLDCTELLRATGKNSVLATSYHIVTSSTLTCLCDHRIVFIFIFSMFCSCLYKEHTICIQFGHTTQTWQFALNFDLFAPISVAPISWFKYKVQMKKYLHFNALSAVIPAFVISLCLSSRDTPYDVCDTPSATQRIVCQNSQKSMRGLHSAKMWLPDVVGHPGIYFWHTAFRILRSGTY